MLLCIFASVDPLGWLTLHYCKNKRQAREPCAACFASPVRRFTRLELVLLMLIINLHAHIVASQYFAKSSTVMKRWCGLRSRLLVTCSTHAG